MVKMIIDIINICLPHFRLTLVTSLLTASLSDFVLINPRQRHDSSRQRKARQPMNLCNLSEIPRVWDRLK